MARIFCHFVEPLGRDIRSVRPSKCSFLQGKLFEVGQVGQRSKNWSPSGTAKGRVSLTSSHTHGTTATMSVAKVAVSIDDRLLRRLDSLVAREVFRSRSEAIQKAVAEKLARMDRGRLARECAKLLPGEEQQLAEEGIEKDASEWPEY
jgi:Arc/MetJ-type ribon-helix-helix transcriptional regulator